MAQVGSSPQVGLSVVVEPSAASVPLRVARNLWCFPTSMSSSLWVILCLCPLVSGERDDMKLASVNVHYGGGGRSHDNPAGVETKTSEILHELKDYVGSDGGPSALKEVLAEAEQSGSAAHEAAKAWSRETPDFKDKAKEEVDDEIRKAKEGLVHFHTLVTKPIVADASPVLDDYLTGAKQIEGHSHELSETQSFDLDDMEGEQEDDAGSGQKSLLEENHEVIEDHGYDLDDTEDEDEGSSEDGTDDEDE
mmetsp:Transcript_25991/g.60078  ORF Transcript_25991/g.60078 Transcript_25991/m.60078 type:complete len:250 (+) Transcript_25991:3-752(+)